MSFFKKITFKKSRSKKDGIFFDVIHQIIGFKPLTIGYYKKAFTHKSLGRIDSDGNVYNFERLEFLGDSVLSTIVAHYLYEEVPEEDEGYLTKMRSKIVSRKHLNELGKELGLANHMFKHDTATNLSDNVHGNMFEALIGAILLDRGYVYCEKFIKKRVIDPHIDIKKLEGKITSYKSILIEWCQKEKKEFKFEIKPVNEDSRNVSFRVLLYIGGEVVSKATAASKKAAEEKAATRGYYTLQNSIEDSNRSKK